MVDNNAVIKRAWEAGITIPAFNIPYLPILKPIVEAVRDQDAFAFVAVARLEWTKFESKSLEAVYEEFKKHQDPEHISIHLDHIPVIDEDNKQVDYLDIIDKAIKTGYRSVMVDGSRLSLEDNIEATRAVAERAHEAGIPCEAELGAVLGHEEGPPPPYEELFRSGKGFTDVDEAARFVKESGCDWLSVAIGNIHGAVSKSLRDKKKVAARLNLEHLEKLNKATNIPLVLHGGSGIKREFVLEGVKRGIAKINIGTEIRQAYESGYKKTGNIEDGRKEVYERVTSIMRDYFEQNGTSSTLIS
jgi:ketose-bisphosphate aldolase